MPAAPARRGRPRDPALADRRREQILRAATRVFARRGYPDSDLQNVADALRVGKGTIYRYFPSKRALFQAAVDRAVRGLHDAIDTSTQTVPDPLDQIAQALRAYLRYFHEHPEFVELFIQERAVFRDRRQPTYFQHREANIGRWRALYAALMREGRIRPMPPERVTDVIGDTIYGTMFANYMAGRERSQADQTDAIVDLVFHGLLTPAERRRQRPQEEPSC
jgi:AcrR family transcriptional regulator